jgi:transposase
VREYTYAFVAICPFNGDMVSLIMPWANTKTMNIHLAEISKRNDDKYILMFVDRAAWHTAKKLEVPKNIRLVSILPYSPELNPTEHIFDELREKYFHNLFFNNMCAVEDRLETGLRDLENNKDIVQSTTGFNWIVSAI